MTVTERVTGQARIDGAQSQLVIGGRKPASAETSIPTDAVVRNRTTNEASRAAVTVLDSVSRGATLEVEIQGTIIHTGTVTKVDDGVGDRRRVVSFDALHQLKQTFISVSFDGIAAREAFRRVAAATDVSLNVRPTLEETITTSVKDKRADVVLDKLTTLTDTVSFITRGNDLLVTTLDDIGLDRDLENIIDTSAGKRSPQYQSVQVIGNTPTSRRGFEARHLLSSQPVLAEAGAGQPSFIYEDDSITSQQQAVNAAQSLLKKLKKQQQGGFVKTVGRADVLPFDRVALPDAQGGGEFIVDGVEHRISEDGFITRHELGGVV
jgi:hypothetical protein